MSIAEQSIGSMLEKLVNGLEFPSERDFPLQTCEWDWQVDQPFTIADLCSLQQIAPDTPIKAVSLATFFQPVTKEESWHNTNERKQVKRFRELVTWLEKFLHEPKVYKVGRVEMDVYILGGTRDGKLAGVTTKVIET